MQVAKSEDLRRRWGSKGCEHRHIEQEYYLDAPTGQYACVVCGRAFWTGDAITGRRPRAPGN
jgi:hypothetical protein